jgi:hypothetical protein
VIETSWAKTGVWFDWEEGPPGVDVRGQAVVIDLGARGLLFSGGKHLHRLMKRL